MVFLLLWSAAGASAQLKVDRVRPDGPRLRQVVSLGAERSSTLRSMIERIEESDVIAYVRCRHFVSTTVKGRTYLVSARPSVRYVFVEVSCHDPEQSLLMIVAHELQHVVEIASSPSAVDDEALGRLFSRIGFSTCGWGALTQFETYDAIETGMRVRREFLDHQASGLSARMHSD